MNNSNDNEFRGFGEQPELIATEVDFDIATSGQDKESWISAIYSEFRSLLLNDTWNIVSCPTQGKVIGCRVVLRNKIDENG